MVHKKLKKAQDAMFGGALAAQSARVIQHPSDVTRLTTTGAGFLNIGVGGMMGDVAHRMASGDIYKKRRKRKK